MTSITPPWAVWEMTPRTQTPAAGMDTSYTSYRPSVPWTWRTAPSARGGSSVISGGGEPANRRPSPSYTWVYTPWRNRSTSLRSSCPCSTSTRSALRSTTDTTWAAGGFVTRLRFMSITNTSISEENTTIRTVNQMVMRTLMEMCLIRPPSAPSPCHELCAAASGHGRCPAFCADS